ncbi:DUF523 domain-containing protein [Calderihabitans maritimus]|uniref:Uncharacterized protein n=1 Tax=Calderihabitans maritimus TaxID=1246530 RepID=A0A1Z5HPL6_9FIRM|nr:DUF523 domain-containing protein [Calderihabitans maritimus]GAW91454.1 hypothetical protein KKC1_06160 [Calderihabitans maritimus]
MIIVSACLAGICCRYDGGSNFRRNLTQLIPRDKLVLVCPEQLGGLPTPRLPAEIVDGDGVQVLSGRARVINSRGEDVTEAFLKGAEEVLRIARLTGSKQAVLKARSPSCGTRRIYDGTFRGRLRPGSGVTAALLRKHGVKVIDDEQFGLSP